jgi:hypothetical protein
MRPTSSFSPLIASIAISLLTFSICARAQSPQISNVTPTSGVAGTQVTIAGSGFGATQGSGNVWLGSNYGVVVSWSDAQVVATVASGSKTGTAAILQGGVWSNSVNFTVVTPTITSVTPTSGVAGTQVTIAGSGFGATQGSGNVWLGSNYGVVVSWSDAQVVATVASGSKTGTAAILQGGVWSNSVNLTVVTSGGFVATSGQMEAGRYGQTATQLTTGQVLIAGGMSISGVVNSADLYTPTSQTFGAANSMNVSRWLHTATLLNDGTVLVAGGSSVSGETTLNSAEVYDPVAGTFTLLPNTLNTGRVGHTATLLSNGQVLIVGGCDPTAGIIADAELYDPIAQVFIDLGNTNAPRFHHTATLLQNGQVLIAGGETDPTPSGAYSTAEIFNPATWTFTALSVNMTTAREGHAATLLNNGQVLITGGDLPGSGSLNTAEIYNPTSNTFTAVSSAMTNPRIYHDALLLNGGKVLLSGGENDSSGNAISLNTAELYDPTSQTFTAVAGNMTSIREYQTATLLSDGTVLEDGGTDGTDIFNTAEIYTTSKLTGLTSIAISPATPSVPLGAQQLLVATGTFSDGSTQVLSSALWGSSSASVFTVSNDASDMGFATSIGLGNATVTATAAGITGSTTITVPAPALTSITLSPQSPTLPMGTSQQFTATAVYSDGSFQDLTSTATWTSSSSQATVTNGGLVTGVSLGNSTIQAGSGSQSASTVVTVGAPALVGLSLTPSSATVAMGLTQQYQVTGTYSDGSTQDLTTTARWFSVPQSVSLISTSGSATGVGQGTAGITATVGTLSVISTLLVGAPSLVSITVVPSGTNIPVGSEQQFVGIGTYTDGSTQDLTSTLNWASSNGNAVGVGGAGLASAVSGGNSTITASSGSISGAAVLNVTGSSIDLQTSRYQHNATLLNNGAVLFAGGINCPSANSCTYLNSAELYNPTTGTIANTGSMATARSAPAVLLGNGKVLVAGGLNCDPSGDCASLQSAEIYDPNSGTFSGAGNMTVARDSHNLTLLNNGKVLIAGGETCTSASSCTTLNTAELYDPTTGTFTATGALNAGRFNASAVALGSGQVLIAGGFDGSGYPAHAELYDPVAGTFTTAAGLNVPRASATATLLDNGYVLIAGGTTCSSPSCPIAVAEMYASGAFSYANSMNVPRLSQTASLLTNGQLLIAGGYNGCTSSCVSDATTELYDPQSGNFASSQGLTTARSGHTATLLTDGSVLMAGGINAGITLSSTDSYQPSSLALPQLASITISPSKTTLTPGTSISLVATGYDSGSNLIGTLQSVAWNSSAPSIATVSNAAGSAGIVTSLAPGTTTVTASIGTVTAVTQVTVTAPLVSIALSPSNESILVSSPQGAQLTATGTFSDGTSTNLTAYATWTSSNTLVAAILQSSTAQGVVVPVGAGTANITASFGGLSASTSITVVAPPVASPIVSSISPTSAATGVQVTISGSGFGAVQGSGNVILGSASGTVVSWGDTQIVATVPNGSVSGIALVQQGDVESNSVPFSVNNANIVSISPMSGVAGTQVTITGSGFGASQGNGIVWLGTVPGMVTSWSDAQVVATVAANSSTGTAQILQNGVWSDAFNFTINTPHITGVSPSSGGTGTVVTINGSGFGASQGSGNVWIGSTYGSVIGWSDAQVVASVASTAVSGIVKINQDGIWSNARSFNVPPASGSGTTVILAPDLISMVIGETRSIQALNSTGQPVTGLTWTSSNTAIASLSPDDPPILTAVAAGNVTITAGGGSADITVYPGPTLPLGTTIWSNSGDGAGVISIVPAVPSSTGLADVFALQGDGNVQAIMSDGTVAWTQYAGTNSRLVPDFQGGLTIVTNSSVSKLDGMTGTPSLVYTLAHPVSYGSPSTVVHTVGTVFTVDGDTVAVVNPLNGTQVSVPMTHSTYTQTNSGSGCQGYSADEPPITANLMIAGDGYAYVAYQYEIQSSTTNPTAGSCDYWVNTTLHNEVHERLLRVGTDGSSMQIPVGDWTEDYTSTFYGAPHGAQNGYIETQAGNVPDRVEPILITNADQGVLLSLNAYIPGYNAYINTVSNYVCKNNNPCGYEYTVLTQNIAQGPPNVNLITVTSGSVTSNVTLPRLFTYVEPDLQAQDGTFFGIVDYDWSGDDFLASFDKSGTIKWSNLGYYAQIATSDGGVIGQSYSGQSYTFDANGNSTGLVATLRPPPSVSSIGQWSSWLGNALGSAYSILSGSAFSVASPSTNYASTYAALPGGNHGGTGTSVQQEWFPDLPSCPLSPPGQPPCPKEAIRYALGQLRVKMFNTCTACSKYVFNSNILKGTSQTQFYGYLSLAPRLFDGTRSNAPTSVLCGLASGLAGFSKWAWCGPPKPPAGTVSQFMAGKLDGQTSSAVSQTPSDSKEGIMIFFDPLIICNVTQPGQTAALNEAMLFHEALHGDYGFQDPDLESHFDETSDPGITYYLENNVLGSHLTYLHDLPHDPEPMQCPNTN